MTKTERIRTAVLTLRDEGLPEDEIADALGISEDDVDRHLKLAEPPPIPYREPVVTPKVPKVRSVHRLPFQGERFGVPDKHSTKTWRDHAPRPPKEPLTLEQRRQAGSNGKASAECGTESGHHKHTRHDEEPCDRCKEAIRLRSERRRHDAREKFDTEQQAQVAAAQSSKFSPKSPYLCEKCEHWHIMTHRKSSIDTLQLTG